LVLILEDRSKAALDIVGLSINLCAWIVSSWEGS
jgi:hypothetical protein